jgi:dTMP kinase
VRTREPGGTALGERLRDVLLDLGQGGLALDPVAETLLFGAARSELVAEVIAPATARGDAVLCDRYGDSTAAYQGYGRGVDLSLIADVNAAATRGLRPDLTVLLDLAPALGLERTGEAGRADRFGREEAAFHERVRQGYLALAAQEPARWLVVDATQSVTQITQQIWARLEPLLASQ